MSKKFGAAWWLLLCGSVFWTGCCGGSQTAQKYPATPSSTPPATTTATQGWNNGRPTGTASFPTAGTNTNTPLTPTTPNTPATSGLSPVGAQPNFPVTPNAQTGFGSPVVQPAGTDFGVRTPIASSPKEQAPNFPPVTPVSSGYSTTNVQQPTVYQPLQTGSQLQGPPPGAQPFGSGAGGLSTGSTPGTYPAPPTNGTYYPTPPR